ncbi:MAG: dipeptidase [Thermoanaerobaculia bacterium]
MKIPAFAFLALLAAAPPDGGQRAQILPKDYKALAARLHQDSIVLDTHQDVPERLEKEWVDLGVRNASGHVDIPRLKEGGVTAAFFAAYVRSAYARDGGSSRKALELVDLIHRLADQHGDLVFADSVAGIRQARRQGKIAILIGIEGGHAIEDSLPALSSFYRLGVRYMTLTHTNTNGWADSSGSFWSWDFDPSRYVVHDGLSGFGREVVLEMNRLGMLVDISHVSDKTLDDVLEVSRAPVFASHSSCRALSSIPRNLTDDQIRAIAKKGGVVMVNIGSMFLEQRAVEEFQGKRAALRPRVAELQEKYRDDPKKRDEEIAKLLETVKVTPASWKSAVDHIDRIIKIGGRESVGFGTDFDGIEDPPEGLEDVSKLPILTEELMRRGHSPRVVRGVLGENFLKFWERAEEAKAQVPPRGGPFPFTKPGVVNR